MTNQTLQPGDGFGQYRILRLLGRGGMGEVYAVEHMVLRERFALKLLNQDLIDSPEAVERLKREAQVMAKLRHANIVRVDDFGEATPTHEASAGKPQGRYWLRMELIGTRSQESQLRPGSYEGQAGVRSQNEDASPVASGLRPMTGGASSLADYLASRGGKLPETEVRDLLRQILEGLAYAHGKGVVHRDLKPANILLDFNHRGHGDTEGESFQAKIADFGLVRLVGEEWLQSEVQRSVALSLHSTGSGQVSIGAEKTLGPGSSSSGQASAGAATGALLGTYEYMSPERKRGEEADPASDVYSVGLIAFQMLTGRKSPGFLRPAEEAPEISAQWDRLLIDSLSPDAGARPSDGSEFLRRFRSLFDKSAPPPPPVPNPQPKKTTPPGSFAAPPPGWKG